MKPKIHIQTHEDKIEVLFKNTITQSVVTSDHFELRGFDTTCSFNLLTIYRPNDQDEKSFFDSVLLELLDLEERKVIGGIL